MIDEKDTSPVQNDGKYEFMIHYSGREVPCKVEKEQNKLMVHIDNQIQAELTIQDGSLIQTGGSELPDSAVEFIKKRILG